MGQAEFVEEVVEVVYWEFWELVKVRAMVGQVARGAVGSTALPSLASPRSASDHWSFLYFDRILPQRIGPSAIAAESRPLRPGQLHDPPSRTTSVSLHSAVPPHRVGEDLAEV